MPSKSSFPSAFTSLFGCCIASDDHVPSPPPGVAPSRPADRPEGAISRTRREWLDSLAEVVRRDLIALPNHCALKRDLAVLLSRSRERRPSDEDEFAHPCADIKALMRRTAQCAQRMRRWDIASSCVDQLATRGDQQEASASRLLRKELTDCFANVAQEHLDHVDQQLASINKRLMEAGPPYFAKLLTAEPDPPSPRLERMRDNLARAEMPGNAAPQVCKQLRAIAETAEILHQLHPADIERRLDALDEQSEHVVTTAFSSTGVYAVRLHRQGNSPQDRRPLPARPPVGTAADWPSRFPPTAKHQPDTIRTSKE
ncbi:hypothetical protein CDL60_24865 [Roseateles noduli]|nr:hypothetical protein CDL60_24865 [Roseateles noduli]